VAATLATFAVVDAIETRVPVRVDLSPLERCQKQAGSGEKLEP
jgi:hypothetical protein